MLWKFDVNTGEKFPAFDIPSDRRKWDIKLRHIGYSMTGFEIFCIMRSIDWFCGRDFIDEKKIGMLGLSYGGYFSMHTAAADTRIVPAFNDRNIACFDDWSYANASNLFHDAEMAALCAPRRLRIDVGKTDAVFDYSPSAAEAERIGKYYEAFGASSEFQYTLWNGEHRFDTSLSGFDFFFDGLKRD